MGSKSPRPGALKCAIGFLLEQMPGCPQRPKASTVFFPQADDGSAEDFEPEECVTTHTVTEPDDESLKQIEEYTEKAWLEK